MRGYVPVDPETNVSSYQYAVVYVPGKSRGRFPANSVTIKPSAEQALQDAQQDNKYFAAVVIGPSKSSEGQSIYYLAQWLQSDES